MRALYGKESLPVVLVSIAQYAFMSSALQDRPCRFHPARRWQRAPFPLARSDYTYSSHANDTLLANRGAASCWKKKCAVPCFRVATRGRSLRSQREALTVEVRLRLAATCSVPKPAGTRLGCRAQTGDLDKQHRDRNRGQGVASQPYTSIAPSPLVQIPHHEDLPFHFSFPASNNANFLTPLIILQSLKSIPRV